MEDHVGFLKSYILEKCYEEIILWMLFWNSLTMLLGNIFETKTGITTI